MTKSGTDAIMTGFCRRCGENDPDRANGRCQGVKGSSHDWGVVDAPVASSAADRRWWRTRQFPRLGNDWDGPDTTWFRQIAIERAFDGAPPCVETVASGTMKMSREELLADIRAEFGVRPITDSTDNAQDSGGIFFASEEMAMFVGLTAVMPDGPPGEVRMHHCCNDPALRKKAQDLFAKHVRPTPPEPPVGSVFVLTRRGSEYSTHRIGVAGHPIERGNYSQTVLASYDHVVADLNSSTPCGRLVIFSGEPGSGKTFLVRSILAGVDNATHLLVPPHCVKHLGDPEMIKVMSEARCGAGPLVILAEDADDCLVPREQDGGHVSLESIQAVLNLGDGILGNVLNVRVVITTNAHEMKMDRAAIRPGRLCKHVHVGALTGAEARSVLVRLVGPDKAEGKLGSQDVTLASVYAMARDLGWSPQQKG